MTENHEDVAVSPAFRASYSEGNSSGGSCQPVSLSKMAPLCAEGAEGLWGVTLLEPPPWEPGLSRFGP